MKKAVINKKLKGDHQLFCNYIHRFCNQTRLDGYSYCIRHILEDKSAPFRQCSFIHPQNRKRCSNAAEKNEKRESLCPWHSKRAVLGSKASISKKRSPEKSATLLANFENFCQDKNHNPQYKRAAVEKDRKDNMILNSVCISDLETLKPNQNISMAETYIGGIDDDSEDVDSEEEDCLKHAGVYTLEEVARIAKEKVFRLQALYIDQLRRLKHALYESRRNYLHELNVERETYSNIPANYDDKDKEEQLNALMKYHRYTGNEAILHYRSLKVRGVLPEEDVEETHCCYTTDKVKCSKNAVIFSEFCFDHILSDPNQLVYKRCCGGNNSAECKRPVLDNTENQYCSLHMQLTIESDPVDVEDKKEISSEDTDFSMDIEHFQSMDDIASLGLDIVTPGCLFGLDQFGEPGESTDTVLSEDRTDLMQIQPITLNPPEIILNDSRKSDSDGEN